MHIDLPTLFAVTGFVTVIAGSLLILSWLQNRGAASLALWGAGFLVCAIGGFLLVMRPPVPEFIAINFGNAIVMVAYGLMWAGARHFESRKIYLTVVLGGGILWLLACRIDYFYESLSWRITLFSGLIVAYTTATAFEYWRARDKELRSRWPAIVLLLMESGFFLIRTLFADHFPFPGGSRGIERDWIPVGLFALMLYDFCMPFLVINMALERLELRHRRAALIDPLTGVANRRAFLERSERHLRRAVSEGDPAALLVLDLDLFKRVNDTFGHQAGDRVLCAFCEVAQSALRPTDMFGRMGGEEFACLLPGATADVAFQIAERIRAKFEGRKVQVGATSSSSTVSIGIATTADAGGSLEAMLAAADRALYLAKSNGRNRVEQARPPLVVAAPLVPDAAEASDTGDAPEAIPSPAAA
jgi:diguanylate cyclase (GGDEF)-like protein